MKFSFYRVAVVALVFLASVFAVSAQDAASFKGAVGGNRVDLAITRDGESLTGSYYYAKSGSANKLMLKGSISADGSFTMQETDAAGKQTGKFSGKWKEDPTASGASLEGTWEKTGVKDSSLDFYAWQQMIYFENTKLTTREIKETVKLKKADISAEYPELSGGANAAGFNAAAKAAVMKSIAGFRKDLAGLTAADLKMMSGSGMGSYIDITYSTEYADDNLVSINFNEDTFMGGAHPNHDTFTLTYDLKNGKELSLASLFKPGAKYLATIADYSITDLKGRKDPETGESLGLMTDEIFGEGANPTAANYHNWNVTTKGVLITFIPYQVASYAEGPQAVIIPYAKLKAIMAANGPLSNLKK